MVTSIIFVYTSSPACSFNKTVLSRVTSTVSLAQALAPSFVHISRIPSLHLADFALMKPGGFHLRCWQHSSPPCHLSETGLASPLKLFKPSNISVVGLMSLRILDCKAASAETNACIRTYLWVWGGKRDNCGWW